MLSDSDLDKGLFYRRQVGANETVNSNDTSSEILRLTGGKLFERHVPRA